MRKSFSTTVVANLAFEVCSSSTIDHTGGAGPFAPLQEKQGGKKNNMSRRNNIEITALRGQKSVPTTNM